MKKNAKMCLNLAKYLAENTSVSTAGVHLDSIKILWKNLKENFDTYSGIGIGKKVSGNNYLVPYVIGNKRYNFIANVSKGPSKITKVVDINGHDITAEIKPFLGPSYDFHTGSDFTPDILGYDKVTIHYLDDSFKTFSKDDPIPSM